MLDPNLETVVQLNWLPTAPKWFADQVTFTTVSAPLPARPDDAAQWQAFRASFASIERRTADLRLYRLIQLLNTPLVNVCVKDAYDVRYKFWERIHLPDFARDKWSHLWSYQAASDNGRVVAEFGFDHALHLHSPELSEAQLSKALQKILANFSSF
jgi:hypothetical protein